MATPPAIQPELRQFVDTVAFFWDDLRLYVEISDFAEAHGLRERSPTLQDALIGWSVGVPHAHRDVDRGRDLVAAVHKAVFARLEALVYALDRRGFRQELDARWQIDTRTRLRDRVFTPTDPDVLWPAPASAPRRRRRKSPSTL